MTKRYSYSKSELTDLFVINDELHKETFSGMDDEYNCSRIVRKLNTLTDENEQLRKENDMFSCELSVSANKEISRNCRIIELEEENKQLKQGLNDDLELIGQLQEENEQLKQFKEKVFTWIDKEIARNEEAIKWGKETGADSGSMGFYNHMLKRLKKELEK